MAIINCPDCKKEISDSSKHCIHCGCQFIVCKECGAVLVSTTHVCTECGYNNTQVLKNDVEFLNDDDSAESIIAKWEKETPSSKIPFSFIIFATLILSVALLIIGVIVTFMWANGDSVSILTKYKDVLLERKLLFIFSSVVFTISSFFTQFQMYYFAYSFTNWSLRKKLNINELIKKELSLDFSQMTSADLYSKAISLQIIVKSKNHIDNESAKNFERNLALFSTIGSFISSILISTFFIVNTESYMNYIVYKTFNDSFGFSDIKLWWVLIAGVIFYIIKRIITNKFDSRVEKNDIDWVNKNHPEYSEKYKVYIANVLEYIADSSAKS